MNGYKVAFQLYSSRNFPPLEAQLEGLAKLGYDGVEPFLPNYGDDPAGFRRRIDDAGLACYGFHLPYDGLIADPERFIDIAQYRDFSSAAQALGYSCSWASWFIDRLEADMEHALIERAVSRGQPMSLTRFGERLLGAAACIDVDDKYARSLRVGLPDANRSRGRPEVRTAIP